MVLATLKVKQRGKSYSRPPVGYHLENTRPVPGPVLICITYLTGCWTELFLVSQHWQLVCRAEAKRLEVSPDLERAGEARYP